MIQRIQSVFLLISVVLIGVCLCSPLGKYVGSDSFVHGILTNTWLFDVKHKECYMYSAALFVVLMLTGIVTILSLFGYENRIRQMRWTILSLVLLVLYYLSFVGFAIYYGKTKYAGAHFQISFYACFPILAFILNLLAYWRIRHDEQLVRAADRLR